MVSALVPPMIVLIAALPVPLKAPAPTNCMISISAPMT
jgi:hypothetical protein